MKKSYIIVLLVLMVIASAAFLLVYNAKHSEDITNGTSSLLVSQHGVSIIVPQEWVKADTDSNSSILAVANSSSKDSDGFNDINVNIERKQSVNSLDYEFKNYCKSLASDYNSKILFTIFFISTSSKVFDKILSYSFCFSSSSFNASILIAPI